MAISVKNNVQNSTYSVQNNVLTLTAKDGYKFATAPTVYGYDDWENEFIGEPVLSADGKTVTVDVTGWDSVKIYGTTIVAGKTVQVSNYIQGATYTVNESTVVVTANTGRKFNTAPTATGYDDWDNELSATATLSDNNTKATFDLTGFTTANLYGQTVEIPVPIQIRIYVYSLINATAQGIPTGRFSSDTPLNIVLTANDGYKFTDAPTLTYYDDWSNEIFLQFTVSEDGKTATFADTMSNYTISNDNDFYVTGEAVLQSTYGNRYGSVNVYRVTDEQLEAFCKKRFAYTTDGTNLLRYDLGDFVNRIRRVFCDVGATVPTTIKCANTDTQVSADAVKEDTQTLDFGTVLIPYHNEDNTDFNSRLQVFLPFVGLMAINSAYVGKEIGLKYEINVVTGDAVALLTYNDTAFATYDCKPSTEIMFKSNTMSIATIGGDEFTAKYLLGLRPYVLMQWNASQNDRLLNTDCKRVVIGNCSGKLQFSEVAGLQSGQITPDEREQITRQLQQGITINNN